MAGVIPEPVRGLVIRYSFLWGRQAQAGRVEGAKDRPCAIVLARSSTETGDTIVTVVPIIHSPPLNDAKTCLRLGREECRMLGLDGQDHWVVLLDLNEFTWPGYDLRPIPGASGFTYGMLRKSTYQAILAGIIALHRQQNPTKSPMTRTNRD